MMSLINSLFITVLFSYWVWSLKQDITSLESHARVTAGPTMDIPPEPAHPDDRTEHFGHAEHNHEHIVKVRGKGGVPTWEID